MRSSGFTRRALIGALLLSASALAATLPAGQARAAVACRADPVVTLSNGITVDLHVTVNDAFGDLKHVSYVLHGPPVASAIAAYPDGTGAISSFTYVPDNNVGNYDADIVVTTGKTVAMTGYMDWVIGRGQPTPTAPAQGHSAQDLHIHMHVA